MRRLMGVVASLALVPALMLSPAAAGPVFGTPQSLPQGNVFEPGVDVGNPTPAAPGGMIFVNGPSGIPSKSKIWRSTDNGATYQRLPFPSPFQQMPGGGDSDVVIGPSGRVYFLDLWAGSNSLIRSDNNGDSWAVATPLTTLPLSDRQWIGLGGPGTLPDTDTVYIGYALIQPPAYVMIARSKDSGVTWTHHKIAPYPGGATGFTGQLVSDETGYVGFIYHQGNSMRYAYSTDDAQTFVDVVIDNNAVPTMPSVARAGTDLYASWIRQGDYAVMTARSVDNGATWIDVEAVSAGGTNMFSWIDARGSKVAVTWYGSAIAGQQPNANAGPWYLKYSESVDAGVTYTAPVNAVASAVKNTPICTSGLGCDIGGSGGRELGDFLQVAIDRQGKSIISYVDAFARASAVVKQAA